MNIVKNEFLFALTDFPTLWLPSFLAAIVTVIPELHLYLKKVPTFP